jgi:hypothetical protein
MTRGEEELHLSNVLSRAFRGWEEKWNGKLSEPSDRRRTWRYAFSTSLAMAETTDAASEQRAKRDNDGAPADDPTVHRAELDEIRLRRRLADQTFIDRCNAIIEAIGDDPEGFCKTSAEAKAFFDSRIQLIQGKLFDPVVPNITEEKARLTGLALSGGGIRSATFALGIFQGLASLGILPCLDYLSTVSGCGYAGSWLPGSNAGAWTKCGRHWRPRSHPIRLLPNASPSSFSGNTATTSHPSWESPAAIPGR